MTVVVLILLLLGFAVEVKADVMPSLADEKAAYTRFGWTWTIDQEPLMPTDWPVGREKGYAFNVSGPDMHGTTEGDDLWTYLQMYVRTGQAGYSLRATEWARYFKDEYRQCTASDPYTTYCFDRDAFDLDHAYGTGLIAWSQYTGNAAYLAVAELIAGDIETYWSTRVAGAYPVPGLFPMAYYSLRQGARHLLLLTKLAEVTGTTRWIVLRDRLIELWMQSYDWDVRGMYFLGDYATDQTLGAGQWAAGTRVAAPWQIGMLAEAFAEVYRTTGRLDVKARLIEMARYIDQYGTDPSDGYTGDLIGFQSGSPLWVPTNSVAYTTDLTNILVYGYKLTGDASLLTRAKYVFGQGTRGTYGYPHPAVCSACVGHFVDTQFDTSLGDLYLANNKGELFYTYRLFENGGAPTVEGAGTRLTKGTLAGKAVLR